LLTHVVALVVWEKWVLPRTPQRNYARSPGASACTSPSQVEVSATLLRKSSVKNA
jgi:hypothetical protein